MFVGKIIRPSRKKRNSDPFKIIPAIVSFYILQTDSLHGVPLRQHSINIYLWNCTWFTGGAAKHVIWNIVVNRRLMFVDMCFIIQCAYMCIWNINVYRCHGGCIAIVRHRCNIQLQRNFTDYQSHLNMLHLKEKIYYFHTWWHTEWQTNELTKIYI